MLSFCGLECTKCEAYIATQNNDDTLRAKVAQEWAQLNNAPILPEHINCTGCLSEGVKTYYCDQMCEIRKCSKAKNYQNCADCQSYACEKLSEVFHFAPDAKQRLDSLRKPLNAERSCVKMHKEKGELSNDIKNRIK